MIANIAELYHIFEKNMPPRIWWPAENSWEVAVGAILVQNTNWKNVDRSLENFRTTIGFDPEKITDLHLDTMQDMIRPSGFFTNKSLAIQALFQWFRSYQFNLQQIKQQPTQKLREELLEIRGIGEETADVLLVFIFDKVLFIADRYAQRLFCQLGVQEKLNYSKLQKIILLPKNFSNQQARNLHGWIVDYGQNHLKNETAWASGFLADFHLEVC